MADRAGINLPCMPLESNGLLIVARIVGRSDGVGAAMTCNALHPVVAHRVPIEYAGLFVLMPGNVVAAPASRFIDPRCSGGASNRLHRRMTVVTGQVIGFMDVAIALRLGTGMARIAGFVARQ